MLTGNRFIQIAYPVIIFFSLLLAWNSVGQVNGLDQNDSKRSPAQIQTSCSTGHLNFLEARSCKEEKPPPQPELNSVLNLNLNGKEDFYEKHAH